MRIAICNELFQGWPIEKVFDYAAQLGYDGVEIAPFTLGDSVTGISPARRKAIRRAAENSGVEIVGLHWLLVKPEGLYINHPDEKIRRRTQEYIEALIHFCADLGGKVLVHGSPHQRTVQEGWKYDESWERAKETFRCCLETARERKVIYCVEPLSSADTNFINTVEEASRLVREIRHPNFKTMLDCRNAAAEEKSIPKSLVRGLDSRMIRHIHVNDANGRGPGFGNTRFGPILKTLVKNGYKGYISVEVFDLRPIPRPLPAEASATSEGSWKP